MQVLPAEATMENVPIVLIDTYGHWWLFLPFLLQVIKYALGRSTSDIEFMDDELLKADVILLIYSAVESESFARISSYWLPFLGRKRADVPIVVIGNKVDLRTSDR